MEIEVLSLCRLCLKSSEPLIDVFQYIGPKGLHLCEVIADTIQLPVSRTDGLPPTICKHCEDKLMEIQDFREMCISSRIKLLEATSEKGTMEDGGMTAHPFPDPEGSGHAGAPEIEDSVAGNQLSDGRTVHLDSEEEENSADSEGVGGNSTMTKDEDDHQTASNLVLPVAVILASRKLRRLVFGDRDDDSKWTSLTTSMEGSGIPEAPENVNSSAGNQRLEYGSMSLTHEKVEEGSVVSEPEASADGEEDISLTDDIGYRYVGVVIEIMASPRLRLLQYGPGNSDVPQESGDGEQENTESSPAISDEMIHQVAVLEKNSESKRKKAIQGCIHGIVYHCKPQCLQYVVDSFGETAVDLFFEEIDVGEWKSTEELKGIRHALAVYGGTKKRKNIFHFCSLSMVCNRSSHVDAQASTIRLLLAILEGHDKVETMAEFVFQWGLNSLFTDTNMKSQWFINGCFEKGDELEYYLKTLAEFIAVKHRETFIVTVRKDLMFSINSVHLGIGEFDAVVTYLFPSLADAILDEFERMYFLLEDFYFFNRWSAFVEWAPVKMVTHVWNYISSHLREDHARLEFLTREDMEECNSFMHALLNECPLVAEYIWDRLKELIAPEERSGWLIDTLKQFVSCFYVIECTNLYEGKLPRVLDFLSHLLEHGLLSEKEVSALLFVEESGNKVRHVDFRYRDWCLSHLLPFYRLLSQFTRETARDALLKFELNYDKLIWSFAYLSKNKWVSPVGWKGLVEEEFARITSLRTFQEVNIIPIEHLNRMKTEDLLDTDEEVILKNFFVAFHKCVEAEVTYFGVEHLLERFRDPLYSPKACSWPNILHGLLLKDPILVPYVCTVLLVYLSKEDVGRLLLGGDLFGDTVFHYGDSHDRWGFFYDVARCVLGFEALTSVHTAVNVMGNSVLEYQMKFSS